MRDADKTALINFLSRMGMYICPSDKTNVVSFLTGYEFGALGECGITDSLSKKLEDKYQIQKLSTGWPDQIQRYAKELNVDWMQAFHLIAAEVLNEAIHTQKT